MLIHIVSATSVYTDDTRTATSHLALCGERLGAYAEASKTHPVGNFLSVTSPTMDTVTCGACRNRKVGKSNRH
jgi:hypothetical protein